MVSSWLSLKPSWTPSWPSGGRNERQRAILGSSWADLDLSWQPHGLSWRYLGGLSGRPRRSDTLTGENLKNFQTPKEHRCFLSLGALLEGLLEPPEASWGILDGLGRLLARLTLSEAVLGASLGLLGALLERFWAVLGPSWPSWGHLGSLLGDLGVVLGRLGALFGAAWAVLALSWRPFGPFWAVGSPNKRSPQNQSNT